MRSTFAIIDYHANTIFECSTTANDYSITLKRLLETNGWTEDEYIDQLLREDKEFLQ